MRNMEASFMHVRRSSESLQKVLIRINISQTQRKLYAAGFFSEISDKPLSEKEKETFNPIQK